jgi:hypothetical protein
MADELIEGWGVIATGDKKAHYYRKQFSLCGRRGFYRGPLEPDSPSPDNCSACEKKRVTERKKLTK